MTDRPESMTITIHDRPDAARLADKLLRCGWSVEQGLDGRTTGAFSQDGGLHIFADRNGIRITSPGTAGHTSCWLPASTTYTYRLYVTSSSVTATRPTGETMRFVSRKDKDNPQPQQTDIPGKNAQPAAMREEPPQPQETDGFPL